MMKFSQQRGIKAYYTCGIDMLFLVVWILTLSLCTVFATNYRQCDAGTNARFPEVIKFNIDEVDYENGLDFQVEALNMSGSGVSKHIGSCLLRLETVVPKYDVPVEIVVELTHYGKKKEVQQGRVTMKAILMTGNVVRNRPAVLKLFSLFAKDLMDTGTMVDGQDPCLQISLNDEIFTTER